MQQRYCECGHNVLVAYVMSSKGVLHLYHVSQKLGNWMCCPECGKHLDIDELR